MTGHAASTEKPYPKGYTVFEVVKLQDISINLGYQQKQSWIWAVRGENRGNGPQVFSAGGFEDEKNGDPA
jgi:hypothetical protein